MRRCKHDSCSPILGPLKCNALSRPDCAIRQSEAEREGDDIQAKMSKTKWRDTYLLH